MGVCAGFAGTDTHLKAVHRGARRPDEQRRHTMLAALSNNREQLFSCKGLKACQAWTANVTAGESGLSTVDGPCPFANL